MKHFSDKRIHVEVEMLKRKTAAEYFERNLKECCSIVRSIELGQIFSSSPLIVQFFHNYRVTYGLNELSLFLTALVGLGHFGDSSSVYSETTNNSIKNSLFLVVIGPSGKSFFDEYQHDRLVHMSNGLLFYFSV